MFDVKRRVLKYVKNEVKYVHSMYNGTLPDTCIIQCHRKWRNVEKIGGVAWCVTILQSHYYTVHYICAHGEN